MHSEGYCSLSVSVLVAKLASQMSNRAKNDTTYLTGNADQMICGSFAINASFKGYGVISLPTASYGNIAVVFCAAF